MPNFPCLARAALAIAAILATTSAALAADIGQWGFNPPTDTFNKKAVLDLRSLNEKVAGAHGFIKLSPSGNSFVRGDGRPIRFWSITDYDQRDPGMAEIKHQARWMAKRGVNMDRVHTSLQPVAPNSKITDVNEVALKHVWKAVAAMKAAGIYTTVSVYWAAQAKILSSWHVPGGPGAANEAGSANELVFWDPTMQKGYKAWLKALLTRKNPYTGIALGKDPALAIISLQNEDSMLFWSMRGNEQDPKNPRTKELEGFYGKWLIHKYGSLQKAFAAWGRVSAPGDDFAKGRAGLFINWYFTKPTTAPDAKRLADQLHFFARTMFDFNKNMAHYIHVTLGCPQLINDGNWRTVDDVKLLDVERWTYTAGDVVAVNKYFTGVHEGSQAGWGINPGDHYTNASALLDPRAFPLDMKQVVGHPSLVTESSWVPPLKYQSEGPFLVAAYGSLTGFDSLYWFCIGGGPEWQVAHGPRLGSWQPAMGKWMVGTPEQLGMFPAAALMFRRMYITQGKPAVFEGRALADMWRRRTPIIAEDPGFDPNRDTGNIARRSNIKHGVNPLAFLVGPVEAKYGVHAAPSKVIDLKKYIHTSAQTVVGDTGQLRWNYGLGICTLDAPKAQGVTGFLSKQKIFRLSTVTIASRNHYATVLLVSLDDRPLATSRKILVQIGTTSRPKGWKSKPAKFGKFTGHVVVSTGINPWEIRDTLVHLRVRNAALGHAELLDANFMPQTAIAVSRKGGVASIALPKNAMYVVLTR